MTPAGSNFLGFVASHGTGRIVRVAAVRTDAIPWRTESTSKPLNEKLRGRPPSSSGEHRVQSQRPPAGSHVERDPARSAGHVNPLAAYAQGG